MFGNPLANDLEERLTPDGSFLLVTAQKVVSATAHPTAHAQVWNFLDETDPNEKELAYLAARRLRCAMPVLVSRRLTSELVLVAGFRNFQRTDRSTEYTRFLSELDPHVERALHLRNRSMAAVQETMRYKQALNQVAAGVLIVGVDSEVEYINRSAQAIVESGSCSLCIRGGRLRAADSVLGRALRSVLDGSLDEAVIPMRSPAGAAVVCVSIGALELEPRRRAIVLMSSSGHEREKSAGWLQEAFGLTPAETDVAECIAEGQTPQETSNSLSIQQSTVRTHLKRIFSKMQIHRQAELVRLVLLNPGNLAVGQYSPQRATS